MTARHRYFALPLPLISKAVRSGIHELFGASLLLLVVMVAAAKAASVPRVEVQGGTLRGTRADGTLVEGSSLVGTVLYFRSGLVLRIDNVTSSRGLIRYRVSQRDHHGEWQTVCPPDSTGSVETYFLQGDWDARGRYWPERNGFSLACVSSAAGKCLQLGYLPWRRELLPAFQACTRMVRADYCGDGRSFTREGVVIDVSDDLGIQFPEPAPGMQFEAAWSPDGAICVHHTRLGQPLADLVRLCPGLAGHVGRSCTRRTRGAVLENRSFSTLELDGQASSKQP